jgi:hypothetical protein
MLFAIVSFIAAVWALLLLFVGNADENRLGWILLPVTLSGGFCALALMKIIECLHESTYRLQNIQKLLERR